jgi:phage tail-like protein
MKKMMYLALALGLVVLTAQIFSPPRGEAAATKTDVVASVSVWIEIEGTPAIPPIPLLAVKGIGDEHEVIESKIAGAKVEMPPQKIPGRFKISDITIRKTPGPLANETLYQWRRTAVDGKVARRNGSFIFTNAQGQEIIRYKFYNAWPSQWKGMAQEGQGVVFEEFVLAVERLERVK